MMIITSKQLFIGGDFLARASHYSRQRALDDFTFPALFAQRMQYYRTTHNISEQVPLQRWNIYINT